LPEAYPFYIKRNFLPEYGEGIDSVEGKQGTDSTSKTCPSEDFGTEGAAHSSYIIVFHLSLPGSTALAKLTVGQTGQGSSFLS